MLFDRSESERVCGLLVLEPLKGRKRRQGDLQASVGCYKIKKKLAPGKVLEVYNKKIY